jgi:hypothetical protein
MSVARACSLSCRRARLACHARRRRRRRRRRPRRQGYRLSPSKNTVVQVYSGRLMASLTRQTLAQDTRAAVCIAAPRAGAQGRISANQHGHDCAAARVTGFSITYTARALGRMLQGIAGRNRKGEFWVEAQFLSKLHTHMAIFCLNNIEGHKKRGSCS